MLRRVNCAIFERAEKGGRERGEREGGRERRRVKSVGEDDEERELFVLEVEAYVIICHVSRPLSSILDVRLSFKIVNMDMNMDMDMNG